ncbi:chymotrypsin-2 [Scaptodrosophila lebanonensis]|uniref:Chymotrypsin-2 n=1 Tax=Drosophila lebanonensis TaxID=7225 RepID=A0A6J2TKK6_DROLE|nr:chymotrypsin-2 [Scaptodrosophila lebanonensis]
MPWLLLLGFLCAATALRMHGEPYPASIFAKARGSAVLTKKYEEPQGRIVGGNVVAEGETPWIVSIQNRYGYHICGGAIIDKQWILTAGSCVAGLRSTSLFVNTGTINWQNLTSPGYFVDQIHLHCNFDRPLYHNDIALLRLSGEGIEFNDQTDKIAVAEIDELEEGENLRFVGWGSQSSGSSLQDYLYKAEGTYLPYEECRSALGNTDDVDLGHVCVQLQVGKGTCNGDTGGPLLNSKGELVGVSNWGVPCGLGAPDVYARAAFYNDWIRTTINGCG